MSFSPKKKVLSAKSLEPVLYRQKRCGKKVVFTNGCFDILHLGHVRYLTKARALGDLLVIGLNSDASVRRLKGKGRPVNDERSRAEVLSALECVDFVVPFTEDTPFDVIQKLLPDVLVKGGDWKIKDIVGSDVVRLNGGRVTTIPFVKGRSTTGTLAKIEKL
jgi:rfaE bifunctional protein nucleotidyltransferase chain/domain